MKYTTSRLGACTIICFREIAFNMIGGIRLAVTHVLFALPEKFPTTGAISVTCGWSMLVLFLGFSYIHVHSAMVAWKIKTTSDGYCWIYGNIVALWPHNDGFPVNRTEEQEYNSNT